jgi:hypothetical protein
MDPKTETVLFRTSIAVKEGIDEKAQRLNLNRSDYMRLISNLSLQASCDASAVLLIDARTINRMFTELNRWGKNYNQGIKALNTIALKLKKAKLSEEEKTFIAAQSKNAWNALRESKDGLLNVDIQLVSMAKRLCIVAPGRLIQKLGGGRDADAHTPADQQ